MTTEVFIATDKGIRTGVLPDFVSLEYVLTENNIGSANVVVPGTRYEISEFERDYRLQIERDGQIEGETSFLIRQRERILNRRGEKLLSMAGFSAAHLLKRRYILYYAGSSQALKSSKEADDLMKALAEENLGSGAQHMDRDIAAPDLASYFDVAADATLGPATDKGMSRRPLLTVLQEVAEDAFQSGTWVGFDVVLNDDGLFEFRTYIDQRGDDHGSDSGDLITFSPERGNLVDIRRTWDWTEEVTVGVAAGQEEGASRAIEAVEDTSRSGASIFNWIERVASATHVSTTAALQAEARQTVREGRPRDILTARILDTPGTKRGVDWGFGDIVALEFEGETFNARAKAVRVMIRQGGFETTDVAFRLD